MSMRWGERRRRVQCIKVRRSEQHQKARQAGRVNTSDKTDTTDEATSLVTRTLRCRDVGAVNR
jgi:hypothetical protein